MKKIVITGGAGFIGSHVVDYFAAAYSDTKITVLDKMTYAADTMNIIDHIISKRIKLVVGDIRNIDTCMGALQDADLLIHVAAESHVDNSFGNSLEFTRTNVEGTHALMEACRVLGVPKILHVSTDEVYGEVVEGAADENALLQPTNPYSASKASAEMIIRGYEQSFNLPVITVRSNNIFGTRQFPEKIIPRFITLLIRGEKLTLHGTGENRRHYLSAQDFAAALDLLLEKGKTGERYNIGTDEEYTNIEVAHMICELFGLAPADHIAFIEDRPFNDARYALNWDKIGQLGWKPERRLELELGRIARWYYENFSRYYEDNGLIKRKPLEA